MSQNPIQNPFDMKKDAGGKFIPPDFVDADIDGPIVPTVEQLASNQNQAQSINNTPDESSEDDISNNVISVSTAEIIDPAPQPQKITPKEHNLRRLREELERERSEKDAMLRELEMMRRVSGGFHQNHQHQTSSQRVDVEQIPEIDTPDIQIGDDDLVEGKHLKQYVQQMQRQMQESKKQYAHQAAQAYNTSLEIQLKAQYPDFDQVVSQANLKDLAALHPELAATLNNSPDLRSQAVSAYTMIKNLGIDQSLDDPYMAEKEKIRKNSAKPRPSNSVTPSNSSPLAQAGAFSGELTPALRKQLQTEMEQYRRR